MTNLSILDRQEKQYCVSVDSFKQQRVLLSVKLIDYFGSSAFAADVLASIVCKAADISRESFKKIFGGTKFENCWK